MHWRSCKNNDISMKGWWRWEVAIVVIEAVWVATEVALVDHTIVVWAATEVAWVIHTIVV